MFHNWKTGELDRFLVLVVVVQTVVTVSVVRPHRISVSLSLSLALFLTAMSCPLISPVSSCFNPFWKLKEAIENRSEDIRWRKMAGRRKVDSSLARLQVRELPRGGRAWTLPFLLTS